MILHIINTSSVLTKSLQNCLRYVSIEDKVLFINDGVYSAEHSTVSAIKISQHQNIIKFYALKEDVEARQVKNISAVRLIDYNEFVALTIVCSKSITW